MTQDDLTTPAPPAAGPHRRAAQAWRVCFAVALAVQLVVLYAPRSVSPPGGFPWDKVAHLFVFAAVAWTGAAAGVPLAWLTVGLLAHAVASEAIQHWLLPHRSGDPGDAVADAVGTLVAVAAWWVGHRGRASTGAAR